jgi:hypothetical protein
MAPPPPPAPKPFMCESADSRTVGAARGGHAEGEAEGQVGGPADPRVPIDFVAAAQEAVQRLTAGEDMDIPTSQVAWATGRASACGYVNEPDRLPVRSPPTMFGAPGQKYHHQPPVLSIGTSSLSSSAPTLRPRPRPNISTSPTTAHPTRSVPVPIYPSPRDVDSLSPAIDLVTNIMDGAKIVQQSFIDSARAFSANVGKPDRKPDRKLDKSRQYSRYLKDTGMNRASPAAMHHQKDAPPPQPGNQLPRRRSSQTSRRSSTLTLKKSSSLASSSPSSTPGLGQVSMRQPEDFGRPRQFQRQLSRLGTGCRYEIDDKYAKLREAALRNESDAHGH